MNFWWRLELDATGKVVSSARVEKCFDGEDGFISRSKLSAESGSRDSQGSLPRRLLGGARYLRGSPARHPELLLTKRRSWKRHGCRRCGDLRRKLMKFTRLCEHCREYKRKKAIEER